MMIFTPEGLKISNNIIITKSKQAVLIENNAMDLPVKITNNLILSAPKNKFISKLKFLYRLYKDL